MSDTSPVIVEHVSKRFREHMRPWRTKDAVRDISFSLMPGTVTGFVGHNGAGKTTTMKMILGFITPTGGKISVFGASPRNTEKKHRIGYLPEHPYFSRNLTARELLRFFGSLSGVHSKDLPGLIERTLRIVSLSDVADTRLAKFSKGMLQRAGLAQAIIHSPDILILDEPMSGLDPAGRREIKRIIRSLRKEGKTVLFSSHILSDVEDLSDSVIMLENGCIKTHGRVRDILSAHNTSFVVSFTAPGQRKDAVFARYENVRYVQGVFHLTVDNETAMNELLPALIDDGCIVTHAGPKYTSLEEIV